MATAETSRPLVFISASHKNSEWRDRLKAALETDGRIDWWDDSRISPGQQWAAAINEAVVAARVAVVLLSPEYLASKNAMPELAILTKRAAEPGVLALFPIVVRDCPWNSIKELRDVQVWATGRPLDSLPQTVLQIELKAIADGVARTALEPPSTGPRRMAPVPAPAAEPASEAELDFSSTAARVLGRARELALRTGRGEVTSSCLLFALTDSEDIEWGPADTRWFVRKAMERTGKYGEALNAFMNDASKQRKGTGTLQFLGTVSSNVRATMEAARVIAERTTRGPTIHNRHLFAALLTSPAQQHDPVARKRLQQLGIDLGLLAHDFRVFLRESVPDDNERAWDAILDPAGAFSGEPPSEPAQSPASSPGPHDRYISGPPGYTSEFVGVGGTHPVSDELGVKESAHRLAELIALRETRMPLAIGLFGDWGSGKSHFMNLIDRHLKMLAATGAAEGPWCTEIVPIYFNAWHYLDANLWASLVTEIFDGLFRHLEPKQDALETARTQLRDAGGAVALAEEEVTRARAAVATASAALEDAREEKTAAREAARGLLNNLTALVSPDTLNHVRTQLEDWLGVKAEVATLTQLALKHRDVASVTGRFRELWRRAVAQPGRWWRLGWLAGLLVVMPAVLWIAADSAPALQRLLGLVSPYVKLALGWAIGAITWLTPGLVQVQRHLAEMERLQKEAEDAAARARTHDPHVVAAERRVRDAEAAAAAAETGLAQAKAIERRLTQTVDDLLPERRLTRFIEARARSSDYRGQLGLVSLARRDFQELSDIFTDREALDAKKKLLPAEEAAALERLGASIDRIVLFVDDLDRCQADKVVDVLQAVHLLLAFPLFAVVVGVDQRCLRRSLRTQFVGLLSGERSANDGNGEDDVRPATPLDYLEKIFHVPFHLQPMNQDGFADLMTALTRPRKADARPAAPIGDGPPSQSPADAAAPQTVSTPAHAPGAGTLVPVPASAPAATHPVAPPTTPQTPKTIGSVPLHEWERIAIKDYYPLVRTPRGATRFLNTYRLLRAGLAESDWTEFRGDGELHGEFRIAMLLLASAAGHPAVAREWFHLLREKAPQEVQPSEVDMDPQGWEQLKTMYASTVGHVKATASRATVGKWIERVEQFTF